MSHIEPQPAPVPGEGDGVWTQLIADMQARDQFGRQKYRTALHVEDGREGLVDAFQEALDLLVYLKKAILQREQGILTETQATLEAMTKAIALRTTSGVKRSAAELDALIDLYREVERALGLGREGK
jgi:hypothetical protein